MFKFFLGFPVLIVIVLAGWSYIPKTTQNEMLGFIGSVKEESGNQIKDFLSTNLKSENPQEERKNFLQELKQNLLEIKKVALQKKNSQIKNGATLLNKDDQVFLQKNIDSSEEIIQDIEKTNKDLSLKDKVVDQFLHYILPAQQNPACNIQK